MLWALVLCAIGATMFVIGWRRSGHKFIDFLGMEGVRAYVRFWHGWSSNGAPPLPASGPAILYSNHTCSADAAFLQAGCNRWLSFVIAREFCGGPMQWVFDYLRCVPVSRLGQDIPGLRTALRRLSDGCILCIFPEGNLSNAGNPRPRTGKPGVALLALRSGAPVIPARVWGGPQVSEVADAWLKPSRVRIIYGQPVDLSAYRGRRIDRRLIEQVGQLLMDRVRALEPGSTNGRASQRKSP